MKWKVKEKIILVSHIVFFFLIISLSWYILKVTFNYKFSPANAEIIYSHTSLHDVQHLIF